MAIHIPGYRIIRKINHGGMSTVYLAIQISVGRIVALKIMNPSLTSDPAFNERFQREATIVGQLSHPNIVAIYDIGRKDDLNYIAMDYLPNGSVHDKMISGITGEEALRVTKDIASALDHAHEKGYIHRDIKPENILFRADNSAVLSDFGVAKGLVGVSKMTHVGTIVGTPHYMSPEQARGKTVDSRSDLYSLGVVFYEMLTGSLPYSGEDAVTIALKHISAPIPKLPLQSQQYQKILEKFLAKDPAQRFQSGNEICAAIEQLETSTRITHAAIASSTSTNLSVLGLLRALFPAAGNAIRWRYNNIKNLLSPENVNSDHHIDKSEPNYTSETLVNTHVHPAINTAQFFNPKNNSAVKWLPYILLSAVLWCVFSVTMQQKLPNKLASFPVFLQNSIHTTAQLFFKKPNKTILAKEKNNIALLPVKSSNVSSLATSSTDTNNVIQQPEKEQLPILAANQTSSSASSPPPAFKLSISVTPEKSRIKILNISEKYKDGIELIAGRYHVEITSQGYLTKTEWIDIKDKAVQVNYQLEEDPVEKTIELKADINKTIPELVRIPAGNFIMGNDENLRTSTAHKVVMPKPFSIGKYEVTFNEYDAFVQATNRAQPGDNGGGRDTHPVINVSWEDAQAYTRWLSKVTGKKFRLPTESEWEYVARAGTKTVFWWSDYERDSKGRANCKRGCYSRFSGLFGSKTAPVGSYAANAFGVFDTAGNVAEWVQDCYRDHYPDNSSTSNTAYETKQCQTRTVRGGSTKSNVADLASAARDYYPADTYDSTLGFRVVME